MINFQDKRNNTVFTSGGFGLVKLTLAELNEMEIEIDKLKSELEQAQENLTVEWTNGYSAGTRDSNNVRDGIVKQKDKEITRLKEALEDCMSYIDVDNLTMQSKYAEWKSIAKSAREK